MEYLTDLDAIPEAATAPEPRYVGLPSLAFAALLVLVANLTFIFFMQVNTDDWMQRFQRHPANVRLTENSGEEVMTEAVEKPSPLGHPVKR